jgi:hemerythrin-like domain-containing protein
MNTAPDSTAPDTDDYRVIHHCLRITPHRLALAVADVAPGDRTRASAIARYWAGYAGEVLAHHTVEDEVFFPRLVERVPVVADHLAQVEGDHHRLDVLMDACGEALERFAATASPSDADDAGAVLRELARHMDSHLDFEDEDLVPLFGRHFTAQEYEALTEAAMKGLSFKQALFSVPWVMHWAPPADRAKMLAGAPLALRVVFRLTRGRHARLTALALGRAGAPQEVLV